MSEKDFQSLKVGDILQGIKSKCKVIYNGQEKDFVKIIVNDRTKTVVSKHRFKMAYEKINRQS